MKRLKQILTNLMNNVVPEERIFSTRDLALSATLVTLRFLMLGFDIQYEGEKNRPVAYFKFEQTAKLEDARQKYVQGLLAVEPKTYMTNVHALKSEIENAKKNPHNSI